MSVDMVGIVAVQATDAAAITATALQDVVASGEQLSCAVGMLSVAVADCTDFN